MGAWTYSHLDAFESCPKKFYHLKVAKDVVEPPGEAAEWGKRVHLAFEEFVRDGVCMPDGMQHWQPLAAKIARLPGLKLCEHQMAIDRAFQPAPWSDAWSRGIADLVVVDGKKAATLDYKTGKRKLTHQLHLYAAYIFHHWPEVEQVRTGFVWLRDKKIDWEVHQRGDIPAIWQSLLPRVAKLESAYARDSWPSRPSGLCRGWCPVTQCPHHRSR